MADDEQGDEGPLSSEALKRDEWRGGGTRLSQKDAPGHILPESESDGATEGTSQERSGALPGTILPPD